MIEVVIVSGARTAVGNFGGSLKDKKAAELGAIAIKEAVKRAGLRPVVSDAVKGCRPDALGKFDMTDFQKKYYAFDASAKPVYFDEVIMGNVVAGRPGHEPREDRPCLFAGLPEETNAVTVNKVCGSGLKVDRLRGPGHQGGRCGDRDRGRHGEHEQRSLLIAQRPVGLPDEHASTAR